RHARELLRLESALSRTQRDHHHSAQCVRLDRRPRAKHSSYPVRRRAASPLAKPPRHRRAVLARSRTVDGLTCRALCLAGASRRGGNLVRRARKTPNPPFGLPLIPSEISSLSAPFDFGLN